VCDIFSAFKAVHVKRPEGLSPASVSFLPGCLPSFNGICMPETGDVVNLSMGASRNEFDNISPDLKSDDPKVVAAYMKENFRAFRLTEEGYLDWAMTQWTEQRWNRTGQVHCNRYSSLECGIVMMGDSVHATSPSIGMGMNTALRDAQKFVELLDEFDDDLGRALPRYTIDRVPEGNALTHIALNTYCFDAGVQARSMLAQIARSGLHYLFPSLVDPDPNALIGQPQYTLSDAYDLAMGQGVLARHREVNQRIRQEFFERETGTVRTRREERGRSSGLVRGAMVVAPVAACAVAMFMKKQ